MDRDANHNPDQADGTQAATGPLAGPEAAKERAAKERAAKVASAAAADATTTSPARPRRPRRVSSGKAVRFKDPNGATDASGDPVVVVGVVVGHRDTDDDDGTIIHEVMPLVGDTIRIFGDDLTDA